ncbi:MAG: alpha/beta hydrolase [Pseudomonadota bacterium]|nr:alpha/beta hydrolase [Pseudomonadota bacterium]
MFNILRAATLVAAAYVLIACTATQQDSLYQKALDLGEWKAGLDEQKSDIADIEMNYLIRKGDGPILMLVHGFSANNSTWLQFADKLPDNYYLIAPDLAGHGKSSEAESYDLERQAERLKALAEHLNLEPFHIVGNSMGGAISAIYAARFPEDVASLILIDSAGLDGENQSQFFAELEKGHNPLIATDEASFEYRMDLILEKQPPLPWPIRPALIRETVERAPLNREIFDDMLATRERMDQNEMKRMISSNVNMPALIMWGEKDRVLDVSAVAEFKKVIPQAEVKIYPDLGHVPMLEDPSASAETISSFISKLD